MKNNKNPHTRWGKRQRGARKRAMSNIIIQVNKTKSQVFLNSEVFSFLPAVFVGSAGFLLFALGGYGRNPISPFFLLLYFFPISFQGKSQKLNNMKTHENKIEWEVKNE